MNTEKLNALKDRAYKTAIAHGFHEEERPDAFWLGLVMSEMGEAINADQKGWHADAKGFEEIVATDKDFLLDENFERYIKDSVEDELADVVIRLFDFAGLKGYELSVTSYDLLINHSLLLTLKKCGLPGVLFQLISALSNAFYNDLTKSCINSLIGILSNHFETMTGSDKDLWWFVEQKMRYNELRPRLNGKKY